MKENHLGKYLKSKRVKAGFTQSDVSEKLGLSSPQLISNFERGLCSPPLNHLKKLVSLYGLDPDELLKVMLHSRLKVLEKAIYGQKKRKQIINL